MRVSLALPNIAKKTSDVKTMKTPFSRKKSVQSITMSIDFVCENRNIHNALILFNPTMASSLNRTVFLTGSTGFIGSRVVEILCQQGWNVRAFVSERQRKRGECSSRGS